MTNIRHVSHDSAACYIMIWRHLLTLFSTLKKEVVGSSEILVTRYHSEQYHFREHSNLQEISRFQGTRISWLIHKISSSTSSFTKKEALIDLFHIACHFNSIHTFKTLLSKFHFNTVLQLSPASLHSEISKPTFCMISSFCLYVNMSYISYHPWFNSFRASVWQRPISVEITFQFTTTGYTNTFS
jgi:hypothetical protein